MYYFEVESFFCKKLFSCEKHEQRKLKQLKKVIDIYFK